MTSTKKVALLGIPWDAHSTHLRGTAAAPQLIRRALHSGASNLTGERGVDLGAAASAGRWVDVGEVSLRNEPGHHGVEAVQATVGALLDEGFRVLSLGGDHTVTYPVIRAYAKRFPNLTILHFDAHSDLYPEYEGDPLSHACPFHRIMEEGAAQRLVQIGIRTLNTVQKQAAQRFGVEIVEMRHVSAFRPEALGLTGPVYLSFDLDALDPAFAPGLSHREPGGLSTRQALDLILACLDRPEVSLVGADVVELNPTQDVQGLTAVVAAKLVKEIGGLLLTV